MVEYRVEANRKAVALMKSVWSAWDPLKGVVSPERAKIDVWNRSYQFHNSLFPTSVSAAGQAVYRHLREKGIRPAVPLLAER